MKSPEKRKFERKVAQYIFVVFITLAVYGIVHLYIYGGSRRVSLVMGLALVYYSFLFYRYQVYQRFETLVWPLVTSFLIFGTVLWIAIGGLSTAIPYLFPVATLAAIVLVQRPYKAIVAVVFLSAQILLVVAECVFRVPWMSAPPESAANAVPVVYILSSMTIAYLVYQLQENFDQERIRLRRKSEAMVEKNKIIDRQNRAILEINQTLEQKVIERTARLELLNQQLTDYAYYNSHKVRGPLCRILGLMSLIKEDEGESSELLDKLLVSAEELDETIKEINRVLEPKVTVEE